MTRLEVKQRMRRYNVKRYEVAQELQKTPSTISVWLSEGRPENLRLIEQATSSIIARRVGAWSTQVITK